MSINFANVETITIPEGTVTQIECNGSVLWKYSRLPNTYQEVEWVQSDGACYIDLNRVPNMSDIIEQKFMSFNTSNTVCSWYGSMPSSANVKPRFSMGISTNGFFVGANNTISIVAIDTNVHTITWQQSDSTHTTYTWDGGTSTKSSSGGYSPVVELTSYLFARHGNSGVQTYDNAGTRIYYHREYTANETLVMSLVPCYRKSDNEIGMYDLVTKSFLTNNGSGSFTKGTDIN